MKVAPGTPSVILIVAQFCHVYPGLYVNDGWSTRDHIIPWKLFWRLYAQIPRIQAMDRLNQARAIGHWKVTDEARWKAIEADVREAWPTN